MLFPLLYKKRPFFFPEIIFFSPNSKFLDIFVYNLSIIFVSLSRKYTQIAK